MQDGLNQIVNTLSIISQSYTTPTGGLNFRHDPLNRQAHVSLVEYTLDLE